MERDLTQEVIESDYEDGLGSGSVLEQARSSPRDTGCISSQPAFSDLGWKPAELRIFTPGKSASVTNLGYTHMPECLKAVNCYQHITAWIPKHVFGRHKY